MLVRCTAERSEDWKLEIPSPEEAYPNTSPKTNMELLKVPPQKVKEKDVETFKILGGSSRLCSHAYWDVHGT